jgi:hypothetical protein
MYLNPDASNEHWFTYIIVVLLCVAIGAGTGKAVAHFISAQTDANPNGIAQGALFSTLFIATVFWLCYRVPSDKRRPEKTKTEPEPDVAQLPEMVPVNNFSAVDRGQMVLVQNRDNAEEIYAEEVKRVDAETIVTIGPRPGKTISARPETHRIWWIG